MGLNSALSERIIVIAGFSVAQRSLAPCAVIFSFPPACGGPLRTGTRRATELKPQKPKFSKGPFTQAIFVAATRCNFCRAKVAASKSQM